MKAIFTRISALLLVLALLTGCGVVDIKGAGGIAQEESEQNACQLSFRDMEYRRPSLPELEHAIDTALEAADRQDIRTVMDGVYRFYDLYDWYYTHTSLADLHYSADLTDDYWEREYQYCTENSSRVEAMLDELYYGLAQSPSREKLEAPQFFGAGFFDAYQGDNPMDETLSALLEREAVLETRYYTLSEEALAYETGSTALYDACADDMAELLVELIAVRQDLAAYLGYDSYPQFAWDYYYDRDYALEQTEGYLADIRQELVPLYRESADSEIWDGLYDYCPESETMDYLQQTASNMGGKIWEAFRQMERRDLYDIAYSENKYNSSFELYLTSYDAPFLFMNPGLYRYDCLTLVHEFGHFCNDYASYGTYVDIDVSEVFSQGMEYLSLFYAPQGQTLLPGKMADSLALYVEQAAYMEFELRMYTLAGDTLSVQGLYDLYTHVAQDYGFDAMGYDSREFVETVHFYTHPMYIVSYLLSNDAALQLYQLEQAQPGAGKAKFEENLDTPATSLVAFLESAQLGSPFIPGRIREVRQILEAGMAQ